jgi:hypothetical protein
MKLLCSMLAGSVLSSALVTALLGRESLEVWLGMFGPLVAATASWMAIQRQYMTRPEGLTGLLIRGFAAKMIFFGGYVTVVLGLFGQASVRPTPFVISFTIYFLALHFTEAAGLYRLQAAGALRATGALQTRNG